MSANGASTSLCRVARDFTAAVMFKSLWTTAARWRNATRSSDNLHGILKCNSRAPRSRRASVGIPEVDEKVCSPIGIS